MANDPAPSLSHGDELSLFWTRRLSLTRRILAVNIFAVAVIAGSFFYLDNYRNRLAEERMMQAQEEVWTLAAALQRLSPAERGALMVEYGVRRSSRLRLYSSDTGAKLMDSFELAEPSDAFIDPQTQPWRKDAARFLDRSIDWVVGAADIPPYTEPPADQLQSWPEAQAAQETGEATAMIRYAPDRTPVITAAVPMPNGEAVLVSSFNARDITTIVRAERFNLSIVILIVAIVSVLLSLFLARTIVRPLRRLALAAVRVRLGRAREVVVPRLPERGDEIGLLARALSDMSLALRQRIDATEAFAADVSHELKNPLASLRSALEGLERVEDPDLRAQLSEIASRDVQRLDRLITDISDASRVDAQLGRTQFEAIDLGTMIENLILAREERGLNHDRKVVFARPRQGVAVVLGEGTRLERVVANLLDNAVSFSPPDGLIEVMATRVGDRIIVRILDNGPGVEESERESIFRRFHSVRPSNEDFGRHSGLGLAIARTIIEAHQGMIRVCDREDGQRGACFEIALPAIAAAPLLPQRPDPAAH